MTWVFNNPDPERNQKFAKNARAIVAMLEGVETGRFKSKCMSCKKKDICKYIDKCCL